MAVLLTPPYLQFLDADGNPLADGRIYTYAAGTLTPKATFTTSDGDAEEKNPVELDPSGRATIWISGAYKFRVYDGAGNFIRETDNISSFTATGESADAFFQTFSGDGTVTSFTLSEALGTDEKTLMVFVDGGGDEGYEIQNISAYTVVGTALTFSTAPATGTNNIYVFAPSRLAAAASASADAADTSANNAQAARDAAIAARDAALVAETGAETAETGAETSETNAAASAVAAAASAASVVALGDVVGDTTPQLGGDLDVNGNAIEFAGGSVDNLATEAQAEAGTATDKLMTPLRTKEAIAVRHDQEADTSAGSGTVTLNANNGVMRKVTATGDITIDFTPIAGRPCSYVLQAVNFGDHTITWTGVDEWAGGSAPALTSSGEDFIGIIGDDGGLTYGYLIIKGAA